MESRSSNHYLQNLSLSKKAWERRGDGGVGLEGKCDVGCSFSLWTRIRVLLKAERVDGAISGVHGPGSTNASPGVS